MALGADRTRVLRDVLRGALAQTGLGLLFGIPAALYTVPAALAATGPVASQLYGVDARNPVVLIVAVSILLASAAVAAFIPARRAASVDPTTALRAE